MTRKEEIIKYSNSFEGKGVENEELKEIIRLAIIDGAMWADKTMIAEIEKRMDDLYPQLPDASKVLNEDISIEEANTLGKYVALESLLSFIAKS